MINLDTKEQIGIQYTLETELPSRYGQRHNFEADRLIRAVIEVPHVIDVELVPVTHDGIPYVDMVITVETHGDNKVLWHQVEQTVINETPNVVRKT